MKLLCVLALLLSCVSAFAQVYCANWSSRDDTKHGYSIYRSYDGRDIGNAYFTDFFQCRDAADVANSANTGIVCSSYVNDRTNAQFYSMYRISDGRDLGRWGYNSFSDCQLAVRYSRGNLYCGAYVNSQNQGGFSLWDSWRDVDVGREMYSTLDACLRVL